MPTNFLEQMVNEVFQSNKTQYLSVKKKNGNIDKKSMVYQAAYTGISDPRPYVKQFIKEELKLVASQICAYNFESVSYGFNIKLAAQVKKLTKLKAKLTDSIVTLAEAVSFYEFQKELEKYTKLRADNAGVCPYAWLNEHINNPLHHKPGKHQLFLSNKIDIFMKDGSIIYEDLEFKAFVDLKYNQTTHKFFY